MSFQDSEEPKRFLAEPAERANLLLDQPFANPGFVLDWLSPSHHVGQFVKLVTGYDIFGEAAKVFAGDWESVWAAAGAFANLADAYQAIGMNVAAGNIDLDRSWDGRAGDAAYVYFKNMASSISSQQHGLHELARLYWKAAEGTWRQAELVSGILKDIGDAAIIALIAASAGTATAETGVGAVVGWGVAAAEAANILRLVNRAKAIMSTASNSMNLLLGEIQAVIGDADGLMKKYPLPAGAYDHPLVNR